MSNNGEKKVSVYNLINNDDNMPKLNKVTTCTFHEEEEGYYSFSSARETVLLLCQMTKMHLLHAENVYMATYDYNGKLIGLFHVASGGLTEVSHSKRIIASYIILSGGFSFRMFHNHSVDSRQPSQDDIMAAFGFKGLGTSIGVECKGSYIISRTGFRCVDTNDDYEFMEDDYEWVNGKEE